VQTSHAHAPLSFKLCHPRTNNRGQRRRERARRSQRAFRTRRAAVLQDLRAENARLKAVIGRTVEAAGVRIQLPTPMSSCPSFVSCPDTEQQRQPDDTQGRPEDRVPTETKPCYPAIPHRPSVMTFRLDSGILDSGDRITLPPLDIAPYLGANRHSLAAQIYWYCTEASLTLLYALGGQHPARAAVIAAHHPVFAEMLRYTATMCSYHYIIALAEARLEFCRVGSCGGDNAAAMRDSASMAVPQRVEEVAGRENRVSEEWWGPDRVAQAVGETLRGRELGQLETAASEGGLESAAARSVPRSLVHALWERSTCFGDGPRWKVSCVAKLLAWAAGDLMLLR
jgi:hypothetical protein